jgi:hypothetical protein
LMPQTCIANTALSVFASDKVAYPPARSPFCQPPRGPYLFLNGIRNVLEET